MAEQDRYIPGVPCWVDITPPDPEAAVAFYGDLFDWEFEEVMPADAPGSYSIARVRGGDVAAVGSQAGGDAQPAAWNTYVWVEDADESAAQATAAGGAVLWGPEDIGDSGRMAVLADPEGAAFCVWQADQHRGAQVVNEPVSLNFNDLDTRDLEGAKAFYGALFGWEHLPFADDGSGMWLLPAYGDFLEQLRPGMRAGMKEMGAPDRFEEVVASVRVIPDDQPAHWGVTFAVDDADAIAARASQLGGKVVSPPTDMPWVRTTVIADPQGATFTASKFVPPDN
jgi:predicted enzyme related to lactoylglutathione lyase